MKWICLIALFGVSCGSHPISQPFLAKPLKKKERVEVKPQVKPKPQTKPKVEVKPAPKSPKPSRKVFAGRLTFQDLSEEELSTFWVIPETGTTLIAAKNATYEEVDGFWWSGSKTAEWFKIPGSSAAWVGQGEVPEGFDGTADRDGLKVRFRSSRFVHLVGFMKNRVKRPGWFSDAGQTRSPVPAPWAVDL